MAAMAFVAGLWFAVMGAYALTHAERAPETPAGHWMAFPAGRRVGGALTILVGDGVMAGSLTLL